MFGLDEIVEMNKPRPVPRKTGPRQGVFEIRSETYALGYRGSRALAVVGRIGHGDYVGIRGRRPLIDSRARRLENHEVSVALRSKLDDIAARV